MTDKRATRRFTSGFRFGEGSALAVIRPGWLTEMWRAFTARVQQSAVVITQASITGLTGGSTPNGDDHGREVVVINTTRIRKLHLVLRGDQVVCVADTTLDRWRATIASSGASIMLAGGEALTAAVLP